MALLFAVGLPLLSFSRALLLLWQLERVAATDKWLDILLQGVRVDLIQLSLLAAPLIILAPALGTGRCRRTWRSLTSAWVTLAVGTLVLLEVATPPFISEYDTRPNRLFVEYLKYPAEVTSTLWAGFRLHLIAGLALTALAMLGTWRLLQRWRASDIDWSYRRLWLSWPLILVVCAFAIRSSIDHRPANPAMFAFTGDPMVNTLTLNSTWLVAHAVYGLRHEARSSEIYGRMEEADILTELRRARQSQGDERRWLDDPDIPTLIEQTASVRRDAPLDLVIVLEEGLGATFVRSLGGLPVTPELEKLKTQGWWFERLYATGTRSIRGIEAVVTGFPPTPAQAVVKLALAQRDFASLASILAQHGYQSEFIYGGESHFDNMRAFFLNNGFSEVTDEDDYEAPRFSGSWGVSDEDLFAKAHQRLSEKHAQGLLSFTLIFTSSNHAPFEFPDGSIDLYEQPKATENNAVKYADYALGRFIERARSSDYWQNTIFLIVADHDVRVRGASLVPIERFHIPGMILGADIAPRAVTTVASQIDLGPTLLSLMGIDTRHPMIGRDLTREAADAPGRAMMQYEQHYAWMEGDQVVVLRPERPPAHGHYDFAGRRLSLAAMPLPSSAYLERRALAHALLPAWLYREQRYRVTR